MELSKSTCKQKTCKIKVLRTSPKLLHISFLHNLFYLNFFLFYFIFIFFLPDIMSFSVLYGDLQKTYKIKTNNNKKFKKKC